jgi:predicted amidohydrolase YtcJ
MLRHNGAGEMLVFSAADFEDFREPRPDLPESMEAELESVVRLLAEKRWPFRIHATYDESIGRILDVYERVNRDVPFDGLHWIIDHAETITPRNIDRVHALGGGFAIQHRMAFQGEYFVQRYRADAARHTPPVRRMLASGAAVGAGTDATRVASYNPWTALAWLVTGRTVGGLSLYGDDNVLERESALRIWTHGSAWFSGEQQRKGVLAPGQFADFALLSADYFSVPDSEIADISSELTVVAGRIVHAAGRHRDLAPPLPVAMPDWSPARHRRDAPLATQVSTRCRVHTHAHVHAATHAVPTDTPDAFWGALGCACFAF